MTPRFPRTDTLDTPFALAQSADPESAASGCGTSTLTLAHQHPLPPKHWVGHADILTKVRSHAARPGPTRVLLSGVRGSGKTALAVQIMAGLRDTRPDGALFADLAADYGTARDIASTVLGGWLRQLGVAADDIPAHASERIELFRAIVADLSLLVLLDNAEDTTHVRDLLPGSSDSVVIVTSRRRLPDLVVDGFTFVDIPPLADDDAIDLIRAYHPRIRRYRREDVRSLATACGRNALTICVAAAFLATHRHYTPADLLAELTRPQASTPTISDTSLGRLLTMTLHTLPAATQDVCRVIEACPGNEFTAAPLAAALVCEVGLVEAALHGLARRNLLTEHPGHRYRMPGLIGEHARQLDDTIADATTELARIERFAGWYLRRTAAAAIAINPGPPRRSPVFDDLTAIDRFASAHDAQAWFDREQHTVLAVLRCCDQHGWDAMTVAFAEALWNPQKRGHTDADLIESQQLGLAAALRINDSLAPTALLNGSEDAATSGANEQRP